MIQFRFYKNIRNKTAIAHNLLIIYKRFTSK